AKRQDHALAAKTLILHDLAVATWVCCNEMAGRLQPDPRQMQPSSGVSQRKSPPLQQPGNGLPEPLLRGGKAAKTPAVRGTSIVVCDCGSPERKRSSEWKRSSSS